MANYRQIHVHMWDEDEWVLDLKPLERYLFIYLFSNPLTSPSGLYKLPMRTMEFHTGLTFEQIIPMLAKFAADGKAYYESGVVYVSNMLKRNMGNLENPSNKLWGRVKSDIMAIPSDNRLKWLCVERLPASCTFKAKLWVQNPMRRPKAPSAPNKPLQAPSSVAPEQEHDQDQEHEKEQEQEQAPSNSPGGGAEIPPRDEYGPTDEPGGPAMMTSAEQKAISGIWQAKMGSLCPPKVLCYIGPKMREYDGVHGRSALEWGIEVLKEGIDGTNNQRGPPPKYMDVIFERWNAEGFQAPRKPYGERVDERADNRDMAERMRRELRRDGIPGDRIEAAIKAELGEGY